MGTFAIDEQKYWASQTEKFYPQVHYSPTKVGSVSKPTVTENQMFSQKLRMLEKSSQQEIEELKAQKKAIRQRIIKARKQYNDWVLNKQNEMLNEYKKGRDEIKEQDQKIKEMKLKEMKRQFDLWKSQFEEKKREFLTRFKAEFDSIKNEKEERTKTLSKMMNEREQIKDLLKNTQQPDYD
ncbi:hypothetical protein EIN_468260 [Entamoeba invadens IP1]|uniref:Uncharacterized protein n=1 Tax=Entamoeba invadens IP1 TaxID=370355 RepID=A0A0A1TUG8_ENTIV|nr:hypothetical protein EIN_468260 [Entamoeba invadens IP1]ELP83692.1 hypothetical protein EIN_468260 [Entamoeba invadens IP1]|eukprot:XP_004183038.1 hypothetical protein EIN_468260 [Entamoeba invadens IP1]